jgi:outer membrane protein OmpA-like peptidoglycan-associated protein
MMMKTQTTKNSFGAKLALAVALAGLGISSQAQVLNTQATRITDSVIHADYQTYQGMQGRIKALNDSGIRVADYHLSKAQCWLDVSFHEYTRNDRSAFPQEALTESAKIVAALEAKQTPSMDTPLVNGAAKLRDDLWAQAASLKTGANFSCAAQKTACAEVELVHAGNEHNQQGWRHAKPYIQIAEDMLGEAKAAAAACNPAPAPRPAPAPVVAPAPAPVVAPAPAPVVAPAPAPAPAPAYVAPQPERITIGADALFLFDKSKPSEMLPEGKRKLDDLAARINQAYSRVDYISLVGYTDRLGPAGYNLSLSQARANTVKNYLQAKGINAQIDATGRGAENQLVACTQYKDTMPRSKALTDCLQPNRRVEVSVTGVKR